MKNKRVLTLIIGLVLIISAALPGTLALSSDRAFLLSELSVGNESPNPADGGGAETPECTCDPKPGEGGEHAEGCPLREEAAEEPKHIEGCSDGCELEDCPCPCHTLFGRLMACETLEEIYAILDETPEEELLQLSEEELAQLEAKIEELEPEPLPPIEEDSDEPVVSEIVYPTVSFSWVAPFGPPVGG